MGTVSALLFICGAILGTLGDLTHVISGTDRYPSPFYPLPTGQPIWVPFLFGGAALAIGLGRSWSDTWLRKTPPKNGSVLSLGAAVALFLFSYAISGFLPIDPPMIRIGVLSLIAGIVWLVFDRSWESILQGLIIAVGGVGVEILLTSQGAFEYDPRVGTFYGVPIWLVPLYFSASIAVGNATRALLGRLSKAAV